MISKLLFLLLPSCLTFLLEIKAELVYTNVIWRHGDRSTTFSLPSDPDDLWPLGLGQLTNKGIQQEYELGKFLRRQYGGMVKDNYNVKNILIRSTDVDRALMSAQASMDGFYRPTESERWNGTGTTWYPVPIHTVSKDKDNLLVLPNMHCPKYLETMDQMHKMEWFQELNESNQKLFRYIEENAGIKHVDILNFYKVYDNLYCKKMHDMKLPAWATREVCAALQTLSATTMGYAYTDKDRKLHNKISKMQGGFLIKTFIKNMEDKILNLTTLNMIGYSAHDMTIVAVLVAMDSYNWLKPPYGSVILVNLHKEKGKYFVEFKYRNESNHVPYPIKFLRCEFNCSWDKFKALASQITPSDHDFACGISPPIDQVDEAYPIILSITVLLLLINLIAFFVFRQNSSSVKRREYDPLLQSKLANFSDYFNNCCKTSTYL